MFLLMPGEQVEMQVGRLYLVGSARLHLDVEPGNETLSGLDLAGRAPLRHERFRLGDLVHQRLRGCTSVLGARQAGQLCADRFSQPIHDRLLLLYDPLEVRLGILRAGLP
jgi:hypothetical protein